MNEVEIRNRKLDDDFSAVVDWKQYTKPLSLEVITDWNREENRMERHTVWQVFLVKNEL
jgi:hypothetical protein